MADKQVDVRSTEDSVAIGDTAGNKVTVTGNKLDVNAALPSGSTVNAKLQDGAGNLITSVADGGARRLEVAIQALTAAAHAMSAWLKDGAGNSISSTAGAIDAQIKNTALETAEGPNTPNLHFEFSYVQAGDIGADYVAGSQGMCKTMKVYPTGAAGGTPAKLSTYKYQDGTQPNGVTEAVETSATV